MGNTARRHGLGLLLLCTSTHFNATIDHIAIHFLIHNPCQNKAVNKNFVDLALLWCEVGSLLQKLHFFETFYLFYTFLDEYEADHLTYTVVKKTSSGIFQKKKKVFRIFFLDVTGV